MKAFAETFNECVFLENLYYASVYIHFETYRASTIFFKLFQHVRSHAKNNIQVQNAAHVPFLSREGLSLG